MEQKDYLKKINLIINPGLLFKEGDSWRNVFIISSLAFGGFFIAQFFLRIAREALSRTGKNVKKGKNILELWLVLFGYYYLSGAFMTFFTGYGLCLGAKKEFCSEIDFWGYLSRFSLIFAFFKVYFGIRADFDRRISKVEFGSKRSNQTGSVSFLIHMAMIAGFNLLGKNMEAIDLSFFLLLGFFGAFLIKAKSKEYICQRIRNMEVCLSTGPLWAAMSLTLLIITEKFVMGGLKPYLFFTFAFLLMTKAFLLTKKDFTKILQHLNNPKGSTIYHLERILFIFHHINEFSKKDRITLNSVKEKFLLQSSFEESESLQSSHPSSKSRILASKKLKKGDQYKNQTCSVSANFMDLFIRKQEEESKIFRENLFHRNLLKIFSRAYSPKNLNNQCSIEWRISLFYYLHDFMNSKEAAKAQYKIIERKFGNMTLEQKLVFNRMKKIFREDEVAKMRRSKQDNVDELDVSILKYKNILKINLQKATLDYHNLWSNLRDITPDIHKVKESLLTAHSSIWNLKKFWKNCFSAFSKDLNSLSLYSNFLKNILKEKTEADKLIKQAHMYVEKVKLKGHQILHLDYSEDLGINSSPICLLHVREDQLLVKSCNKQFSRLFGYSKLELLGKNFLKIVDRDSINFYLEKIHSNEMGNNNSKSDKLGQLLTFVNRSNLLNPYSALMKVVGGERNKKLLVLKIEMEKKSRPIAKILTTEKGVILNHNESVSRVFNFRKFLLKSNGVENLKDIAEKFKEIEFSESIQGKKIKVFNLVNKRFQVLFMTSRRPKDRPNTLMFTFLKMNDIKTNFGLKSRKTMKTIKTGEEESGKGTKSSSKTSTPETMFCFRVDEHLNFDGRFYPKKDLDNISLKLLKNEIIQNSKKEHKEANAWRYKDLMKKKERKNYSEGIRVKRLFDNRLQDIYEFDDIDSEFEENQEEKIHEQNDKKFAKKKDCKSKRIIKQKSMTSKENREKTKDHIKRILNRDKTPRRLRIMRYVNISFAILSIFIFFFNFQKIEGMVKDSKEYVEVFSRCTIRNIFLRAMFDKVFDIEVAKKGIHPYYTFRNKFPLDDYIKESVEQISRDAEKLDEYRKLVSHYYRTVTASPSINAVTGKKDLNIDIKGHLIKFSFDEYFEMIKSAAIKLTHSDVNRDDFKEQTMFFEDTNMYNYNSMAIKVARTVMTERNNVLLSFEETKSNLKNVFLVLMLLGIIVLSVLYKLILGISEEKIKHFYTFEDDHIKQMMKKCESYLVVLFRQNEEEDDFHSEDEGSIYSDNHSEGFGRGKDETVFFFKRKKKSKGKMSTFWNFFTFFIIALLSLNYYMVLIDLDFQESFITELKGMSVHILAFGKFLNKCQYLLVAMSSLMMNPNKKIQGKTPKVFLTGNYKAFVGSYQTAFSDVMNIFNQDAEFFKVYQDLFMSSRCGDGALEMFKNQDEKFKIKCDEVFGGILKYDLMQPISLYYSKVILLFQRFLVILETKEKKELRFDGKCQSFPQETSNFQKSLKCLFTSNLLSELKIFFTQYFFPAVIQLNEEAMKSMRLEIASGDQKSMVFTSLFITSQIGVFCVIMFLSVKSKREIYEFHQMMQYHDLKDIRKNERLRKFFKEHMIRGV